MIEGNKNKKLISQQIINIACVNYVCKTEVLYENCILWNETV